MTNIQVRLNCKYMTLSGDIIRITDRIVPSVSPGLYGEIEYRGVSETNPDMIQQGYTTDGFTNTTGKVKDRTLVYEVIDNKICCQNSRRNFVVDLSETDPRGYYKVQDADTKANFFLPTKVFLGFSPLAARARTC